MQSKEKLLQLMRDGIRNVVEGKESEFRTNMLCPNDFDEFIQEEYGLTFYGMDTNGWQYDYWIYYEINNKEFCLSGSGYFGHMTFAGVEEE